MPHYDVADSVMAPSRLHNIALDLFNIVEVLFL